MNALCMRLQAAVYEMERYLYVLKSTLQNKPYLFPSHLLDGSQLPPGVLVSLISKVEINVAFRQCR